jgi:muramoyltetrapeptide carboxypeptidase
VTAVRRAFPPLRQRDQIALVAPASWPTVEWVDWTAAKISSWGFDPVVAGHVLDQVGYLAGSDADRLADLNAAIRDVDVRAIVCVMGGCGSLRLLHDIDVDALRRDPKPLVGYSDITALHRVWHQAGVVSLHGPVAGDHADDVQTFLTGSVTGALHAASDQFGAELTTSGSASGPLFGGNLEMLARTVGVLEFDLAGHILLLEINRAAGLGMVDRALTQLIMAGALDGIAGIAIGYLQGFEGYADRGWTVLDVLRDRLRLLEVPVLAGLPLGHDESPRTVGLGLAHRLDADAATLTALPVA